MLTPYKLKPRRRRFSIKRFMPTSLFARALLILLVPVVVLQLLVAHVFYARHWDSVVRNMSTSAAADISLLIHEYQQFLHTNGPARAFAETEADANTLGIRFQVRHDPALMVAADAKQPKQFADFYDTLQEYISAPLVLLPADEETIRLRVNVGPDITKDTLEFAFPRKRLASSTTWIFILWMVGSGTLLTTIAILFLRNQVRPIVQLARVAEQFGLGQDVENFSPRGASEVRRAGRAFLMMAERTRRHVQNRTEMLAGISHDLRTPLTRMKLELEMGKMDVSTRDALAAEIEEMRHMIDEYLDFARGDAGEIQEPIDLSLLLSDIVAQYQRGKQKVVFTPAPSVVLMVRPQAIRRAISNLIDNALRYGGGKATVSLEQSLTFMRIKVADAGPGIPPEEHEEVFKPFTRLEPSRNAQTGGVGLGLSIARAIAQGHGGEVTLENLRNENDKIIGLEVTMRLPREVQALTT